MIASNHLVIKYNPNFLSLIILIIILFMIIHIIYLHFIYFSTESITEVRPTIT